ncbi:MAG TPA: 2OG-Fe(II) oxygenase [Gemmataceae bacterium]|nr:2OG-Fe(II) oxygenase [Gemmataceae bacterium]
MNAKKQKVKDRRRARKLADEAWEAADAGNLDLAEKIIRRAVTAQVDNPVIWNDQGLILAMRQKDAEAAEAFRTALSLVPTFAAPFAHLAALRIRYGFAAEAVTLQTQAVKHAPQNALYAEQLQAYRALANHNTEDLTQAAKPRVAVVPKEAIAPHVDDGLTAHLEQCDWVQLGDLLSRDGFALIPQLLNESDCERLRDMFDDDDLFAKTVEMDRPDFGKGVYRYFLAPIPDIVRQLRVAMYAKIVVIANQWQELLGVPRRFPKDWNAFREECIHAGQTKSTPILLKYGPGGFNGLHRDLRGEVFFPIQLAVVLSRRVESLDHPKDGFQGGNFLFCDLPEGKKSRRREMAASIGDALLFCTRDRLAAVGGVYGLQPVKHGVTTITAGERFVLGVPFHDYR